MAAILKELLFRPEPKPVSDVPLGVRSFGHYIVLRSFWELPRAKYFTQLFWSVSGRGALMYDTQLRELPPAPIEIYTPGMTHDVRCLEEPWEYYFFTLDGPAAPILLSMFGLAAGVSRAGQAPVQRIEELRNALRDISRWGELRASSIAYDILATASAGLSPVEVSPVIRQAVEFIHANWNDPDLSVGSIARNCGLHRSAFSRRFRSLTGAAPAAYIARLRIQNALSLLRTTTLPVYEVAQRCGYEDPAYFARRLRQAYGVSPLQFRREQSARSGAQQT